MSTRDISIAMAPGTPEWPGDTPFSCSWAWRMARGDSVNVSAITTSPHVGTHADAPLHVRDEWPAADELPLDAFHGPAIVLSVDPARDLLDIEHLDGLPDGQIERLLLRTGCSIAGGEFPPRWPSLSVGAVRHLAARGLRLLGTDAPSVDPRTSTDLAAHHELFGGGACILENLDLRDVADGEWELTAYPVKITGADAAPVRAVLRTPSR